MEVVVAEGVVDSGHVDGGEEEGGGGGVGLVQLEDAVDLYAEDCVRADVHDVDYQQAV